MSNAHEPKLAALAAHHAGKLTPDGARRLERHLAGCELCAGALVGMRRYAALLPDAQRAPELSLDWARIDRGLERELAARTRRRERAVAGLSLAAAAAIGMMLWPHKEPRELASSPSPESLPSQQEPERVETLSGRVLALAGTVRAWDERGQPVELTLDTKPAAGWLLETGSDGELHLALHEAANVILPASSQVVLAALQEDSIRLGLRAGQVVNKVRRRSPTERYEVVAPGHVVSVRGTHFAVKRLEIGVQVDVNEGTVAVLSEDGAELAELVAPRSWSPAVMPGAKHARVEADETAVVVRRPLARPAGTLALVELPTAPRVVAWDFLGADLSAAAELRMRAPPGEYEIGALLENGLRMRGTLRVDPLGTRFDPGSLQLETQRAAAPRKAGTLDPATARTVIRNAQPALQRCYERSLRNEPASALRVRLRVSLDRQGRVHRIELVGDSTGVSPTLASCIEQVALRLQFDPPGGDGVVFEAPLSFQPVP